MHIPYVFAESSPSISTLIGIKENRCRNIPQWFFSYSELALSLLTIKKEGDKALATCIEFYSKKDCGGETFRMVVPADVAQDNSAVKLWEYSRNATGYLFIDTDVRSLRKCPYCVPNIEYTTPVRSALKGSPLPSSKAPPPSETKEAGPCEFIDCYNVAEVITNPNISKQLPLFTCSFFFNGSSCSTNPYLKEGRLNITIMEQMISQYPQFATWSVVMDCQSPQPKVTPDCYTTLAGENSSLLEIFDVQEYLATHVHATKPNPSEKFVSDSFSVLGKTVIPVIGTLAVIMLIVVLVMTLMLWRKKKRIQRIRERHIPKTRSVVVNVHHQIDPVDENDYVSDITGLHALIRCFAHDQFELSRTSIDIGNIRDSTAYIIGVGEFSIAFKGKLKPSGKEIAVKTMKSGQATARSMKEALKECQVFMMLGKHDRVVQFIGVCTEDVRKGELFVAMEYMEKGPLKSFLVQQRSYFINLVVDEETIPQNNET